MKLCERSIAQEERIDLSCQKHFSIFFILFFHNNLYEFFMNSLKCSQRLSPTRAKREKTLIDSHEKFEQVLSR